MIIKNWKKELCTIPNLLSLFRLALVPVYASIYLNAKEPVDYGIAAGILAVSCLTDAVDGQIARRFHAVSTAGKILDPLADKITQFTLIMCIALRRSALWALVALFVLKESFQLVAGILALRQGRMLTGALPAGKWSTAIVFLSLILLVSLPGLDGIYIWIITAADCLALFGAFIAYVRAYATHSPMIQDLPENT